LIIPAFHRGAI